MSDSQLAHAGHDARPTPGPAVMYWDSQAMASSFRTALLAAEKGMCPSRAPDRPGR
jgi:hypothetical protein